MIILESKFFDRGDTVAEIEVRDYNGTYQTYQAYLAINGRGYFLWADSWAYTQQQDIFIPQDEISRGDVFLKLWQMAKDFADRITEPKPAPPGHF